MKKYIKDNWKWLSIGFFILFIIIPLLTISYDTFVSLDFTRARKHSQYS